MTLNDLQWLSKIFNDTKHRAASLRQLSFLFCCRYLCAPGTRPADDVYRDRRARLLESRLLRRARRRRHQVRQHPGNVLVGGNHHDDGRLRRYGSDDRLGQADRRRVLRLRRTRHCAADTHHRQQLCRLLPGPGEIVMHLYSPKRQQQQITRGQSNLTKSASRGAHSPVRGHPRGSKVVPLNSWGRVSY